MAAATNTPNWLRNRKGVDLIDSLLAPLFVAATFVTGGLATVGIDDPFIFYLDDVLYSAAGTEITWAFVIMLGTLTIAWFTNEATDFTDFNQEQAGIVIGMVLMNLAAALVPAVQSAMSEYWYVGMVLVVLNGAGYYLIAYY